jgi:hypothetical protein
MKELIVVLIENSVNRILKNLILILNQRNLTILDSQEDYKKHKRIKMLQAPPRDPKKNQKLKIQVLSV